MPRHGGLDVIKHISILMLCMTSSVFGQADTQPADAFASRQPEYPNAQQVPAELLRRQSRNVVILPSEPGTVGQDPTQLSRGAIGVATPDEPMLPEGHIIARRRATFRKEGDWLIAIVRNESDKLPFSPPLRVLPNRRLAMLETIIAAEDGVRELLLTGRVTQFQGNNYLLIEDIAEPPVKTAQPVVPDETASDGNASAEPTAEEDVEVEKEPTAEEVIRRLMENKPVKSVVLPEQQRVAEPSSTDNPADSLPGFGAPEMARWPEDTLLIDRYGRVTPSDKWWSLAFEDRGGRPADAPVRLLPNRLLETALSLSGGGARGVVFIVSGETTEYNGENYLLLRKVLQRRDLGNFR